MLLEVDTFILHSSRDLLQTALELAIFAGANRNQGLGGSFYLVVTTQNLKEQGQNLIIDYCLLRYMLGLQGLLLSPCQQGANL